MLESLPAISLQQRQLKRLVPKAAHQGSSVHGSRKPLNPKSAISLPAALNPNCKDGVRPPMRGASRTLEAGPGNQDWGLERAIQHAG